MVTIFYCNMNLIWNKNVFMIYLNSRIYITEAQKCFYYLLIAKLKTWTEDNIDPQIGNSFSYST
jgi:hypothetical protein